MLGPYELSHVKIGYLDLIKAFFTITCFLTVKLGVAQHLYGRGGNSSRLCHVIYQYIISIGFQVP